MKGGGGVLRTEKEMKGEERKLEEKGGEEGNGGRGGER